MKCYYSYSYYVCSALYYFALARPAQQPASQPARPPGFAGPKQHEPDPDPGALFLLLALCTAIVILLCCPVPRLYCTGAVYHSLVATPLSPSRRSCQPAQSGEIRFSDRHTAPKHTRQQQDSIELVHTSTSSHSPARSASVASLGPKNEGRPTTGRPAQTKQEQGTHTLVVHFTR